MRQQSLTKRHTPEEARKIVRQVFRDNSDPENIFSDIADLLAQFTHGTPEESERAKHWLLGKSDEVQMTMGLEHHYPLLDTVDRRYAALLLSIVRQIEKEYECTTVTEKILAENIGVAHIKVIDHSRRLNDLLEAMSHSSKMETTHAAEMLSRQVDRATRQLYTALTTLRQIKHSPTSITAASRALGLSMTYILLWGSKKFKFEPYFTNE